MSQLFRLDVSDPRAWALYPIFEERVLAMHAEYGLRGLPSVIRETLRRRWIEQYELSAYYLILDDDGQVFAHVASWVETQFGVPYMMIYSCKCDQGHSLRDLFAPYFLDLERVIDRLNAQIPENAPHITDIDIWTPWEPRIWQRLLYMSDLKAHFHIMRTSKGLKVKPELAKVLAS